jgi:hypothetical protein
MADIARSFSLPAVSVSPGPTKLFLFAPATQMYDPISQIGAKFEELRLKKKLENGYLAYEIYSNQSGRALRGLRNIVDHRIGPSG